MIYSEAAFFDRAHVAHCAAWENFLRLRRIDAQVRAHSRLSARSRRAGGERGKDRGLAS